MCVRAGVVSSDVSPSAGEGFDMCGKFLCARDNIYLSSALNEDQWKLSGPKVLISSSSKQTLGGGRRGASYEFIWSV